MLTRRRAASRHGRVIRFFVLDCGMLVYSLAMFFGLGSVHTPSAVSDAGLPGRNWTRTGGLGVPGLLLDFSSCFWFALKCSTFRDGLC